MGARHERETYGVLILVHLPSLVLFFAFFKLVAGILLCCCWRGRSGCSLHCRSLRLVGRVEVVVLVHIHCVLWLREKNLRD